MLLLEEKFWLSDTKLNAITAVFDLVLLFFLYIAARYTESIIGNFLV